MRKSPAKVDAYRVFKQAQRFHWSYDRLCVGTDDDIRQMAMIPAMVLSAFASELYLKCLHHIDGGKVPDRTHALQKLFNSLPALRGRPGHAVQDVDNRLKTIFDALRMAKGADELGRNTASPQVPDKSEDPFFVVLQDDKLITHV